MKVIMFVDDEKFILRSLKKVFSDKKNTYLYINSGTEAWEYIKNNHVDLVCTDIRMPDFDGFSLLTKIKEEKSSITRIALCEISQKSDIKRITKENLASLFIFKPWSDSEIKMNIENVIEMKKALMDKELIEFITQVEELPSIPSLYTDLINLIKEDKDIEQISEVVEKDQAITSQILRVANSAFYGRKTGSISQAIMNIGLNNLKNIVLTNSVFTGSKSELKGILKLWTHTIFTNKFTTAIYSELLGKSIPSAFASTGLLHDIGKVLLYTHDTEKYQSILDISGEDKLLTKLEHESFGVSHQDLGAYLLDWWNLPFAYVEAAMYHHRPFDSRIINKELVKVIHLANYYSNHHFMDTKAKYDLNEDVLESLGIDKDELELLIKEIIDKP